jgi:hypothetical protein
LRALTPSSREPRQNFAGVPIDPAVAEPGGDPASRCVVACRPPACNENLTARSSKLRRAGSAA